MRFRGWIILGAIVFFTLAGITGNSCSTKSGCQHKADTEGGVWEYQGILGSAAGTCTRH